MANKGVLEHQPEKEQLKLISGYDESNIEVFPLHLTRCRKETAKEKRKINIRTFLLHLSQ